MYPSSIERRALWSFPPKSMGQTLPSQDSEILGSHMPFYSHPSPDAGVGDSIGSRASLAWEKEEESRASTSAVEERSNLIEEKKGQARTTRQSSKKRKATAKTGKTPKASKGKKPELPNPVDIEIPEAPSFYPTMEDFKDPLKYIEKIRPVAEGFGIAKIIPPRGWNPPQTDLTQHRHKKMPTKKQVIHNLTQLDEVYDEGCRYSIGQYKEMADEFSARWATRLGRARGNSVKSRLPSSRSQVDQGVKTEGSDGCDSDGSGTPPARQLRSQRGSRALSALADRGVEAVRGWEGLVSEPGGSHSPAEEGEDLEELKLLEREYWDVVDKQLEECTVEYANDLDNSTFWSGFPSPPEELMSGDCFDRKAPVRLEDTAYYQTCGWNLNNLPFWPGSVLRFYRTQVSGLTAPWLYLGMQFATFAWHNEDNYLYSLNYHHHGAPKQWYSVPGSEAVAFEKCLAKMLNVNKAELLELLYNMTKMMSPARLRHDNVTVSRLLQRPGEFVVTFPKAYHGGFSYGFNCGEAVNFAVPEWISYSRESSEVYRKAQRSAAVSHDKMVTTLTLNLPDHDFFGGRLVLDELTKIKEEEMSRRMRLIKMGARIPTAPLPKFKLGVIEEESEDYDERRVCKTCKHTLFMSAVACGCDQLAVSCLRCATEHCDCPMASRFIMCWFKERDLEHMVETAQNYVTHLSLGLVSMVIESHHTPQDSIRRYRRDINPFEQTWPEDEEAE